MSMMIAILFLISLIGFITILCAAFVAGRYDDSTEKWRKNFELEAALKKLKDVK